MTAAGTARPSGKGETLETEAPEDEAADPSSCRDDARRGDDPGQESDERRESRKVRDIGRFGYFCTKQIPVNETPGDQIEPVS